MFDLQFLAFLAATLTGTVSLESTGQPIHHVSVLIPKLNRITESAEDGSFRFEDIPDGTYEVVVHGVGLSDDRKAVTVGGAMSIPLQFQLRLSLIRQEITVTASGKVETPLETFNSVRSLDTIDLATRTGTSLGDVLNGEAGVHKRSFGPGTTRPVIRGFDGDRVLIMQDGVRTGTVSSQSGDHGEPVDPLSLERVEIVRGPGTLLYGSNAIGGVVNMITDHHQGQDAAHQGVHGYLSATAGSNNGVAGGSAGVSAATGNWVMRLNGGSTRTGDYHSALGEVSNSGSNVTSGAVSLSRYSRQGWLSMGYNTQRGEYEIPGSEEIGLPFHRHNIRVAGGYRSTNFSLNYSDWKHDETVDGEVENTFSNKQFDYRFVYDQAARGLFSGTAGVWGLRRNYEVVGEEAITPKVRQNSFAVFGVESVQMERLRLQFGGRLENTNYSAEDRNGRNFLGFSGSAGLNVPLWQGGALVASYNHSYRAPALEELFAFGPHPGNLTFEIGDAALRGERSNGLDISLRHARSRFKADANFFSYQLSRYVYLAPTGEIEDGLVEARYSQADARYTGVDGSLEAGVHRNLWVRAGFDAVNARLTMGSIPLPRIPPVRGRIGLDFRARGLSIAPEWTVANRQNRVFLTETPTAGYGVVSIRTSYTIARQHTMHIVSANVFNANNSFYRNHLSFIKELAPEIGRGVVFSYSLRFY